MKHSWAEAVSSPKMAITMKSIAFIVNNLLILTKIRNIKESDMEFGLTGAGIKKGCLSGAA
jgi:hypothetical protein